MIGDSVLLQLVDLVYEAAVNPDMWTTFLQNLSDAFHGHTAALFTQDFQTSVVLFLVAVRSDPDFMQSYQDHFSAVNIWIQREGNLPAGQGVTDQMLASDNELRRTEYYNDWLRPQSLHHALGGVVRRDGNLVSKISILRPPSAGPYGADDLSKYQLIVGHLGRALEVQSRIGNAIGAMGVAEATLNRLSSGVILLDATGRIILANRVAEQIGSKRDGLSLARAGLHALRRSEDDSLQRLIADAVATSMDGGVGSGGVLAVSRNSGRRPYHLTLSPVTRKPVPVSQRQRAALVLISDPDRSEAVAPEAMRDLYGLTAAEARLVSALVDGRSLKEYADQNRVTMNTVRTQLAHAFSKTGTSRQVRLVLSDSPFRATAVWAHE